LYARYQRNRDLIAVGAYARGTMADITRLIDCSMSMAG
ncbi:hypothetical protein HUS71_27410, partial [Pandoraea nosoerga]|nr:hypothetical protein [Pandoraea nosoerga]